MSNNAMYEKLIKKTFFMTGSVVLGLTQIYFIFNAGVLFHLPLTGGVIVWTHLHTMGVITPFFMGAGWYYLNEHYKMEVSKTHIWVQFVLLYGSLLPFLYFVSDRAGSPGLTVSAFFLFVSGLYYILVHGIKLFKYARQAKENRNVEFWIDAVSLYFLLQALMFGFVLALNLSYGFLRRDEILSLRLHSHSGITGFWLLQFILLFYRLSGKNEAGSKWIKLSAGSISLGLFLWTSVHDRVEAVFYLYVILAGLSLVFLFMHLLKSVQKNFMIREIYRDSLIFAFAGFVIAVLMVFKNDTGFLYERHILLIYAWLIFYGVFGFAGFTFLTGRSGVKAEKTGFVIWTYRMYLKLAVLVAAAIYFEKLIFLQVLLAGVLVCMAVVAVAVAGLKSPPDDAN
jgi:hypothetical protein